MQNLSQRGPPPQQFPQGYTVSNSVSYQPSNMNQDEIYQSAQTNIPFGYNNQNNQFFNGNNLKIIFYIK